MIIWYSLHRTKINGCEVSRRRPITWAVLSYSGCLVQTGRPAPEQHNHQNEQKHNCERKRLYDIRPKFVILSRSLDLDEGRSDCRRRRYYWKSTTCMLHCRRGKGTDVSNTADAE